MHTFLQQLYAICAKLSEVLILNLRLVGPTQHGLKRGATHCYLHHQLLACKVHAVNA